MKPPDAIVCKPTPWFLFRALVMLLMFGVFSVLFYIDGSTGYRKKNEVYYLHKTFEEAGKEFAAMNSDGDLTPAEWKTHAEKQSVRLPEDPSVMPADLERPLPWPTMLHDYERMESLNWNKLWLEYSKERGFPSSPPEEPYNARKINEQWIVFYICLALAIGAAFVLIRTLGRRISADSEAITTQQGRRVPYADMKRLDLRKWETKGLAFIDYEGSSGKGRIRIDGLTYGGFKKEHDEPAERLMSLIRSNFSGEILEYAPLTPEKAPADPDRGATP
jgi:hypothetical protein